MRKQWILAWLLLAAAAPARSEGVEHGATTLQHEQRADSASRLGLSDVMREIGYRLANSFWAASGGNWGLAQYQLYQLRVAEDTAKLDDPAHASMVAEFEASYRVPLADAVLEKDLGKFNKHFAKAIEGCNACHARLGYGFLHYQIPEAGGTGAFLDFGLKTEPNFKPVP